MDETQKYDALTSRKKIEEFKIRSAYKANTLAFKIKSVFKLRSKLANARKDCGFNTTFVDLSRARPSQFKKGSDEYEMFQKNNKESDNADIIYR